MSRVLDLACAQLGIVLMILQRDAPKRFAVIAIVVAAFFYYAGANWAISAGLGLLAFEGLMFLLYRGTTDPRAAVSRPKAIAIIACISVSMLAYTVPGIVMMAQPSQAAQILGLLWNCGALIYVLAIFSMTVILGWSTIAFHSIGLIAGFAVMHPGPIVPMTQTDTGFLTFFIVIWLWNTYEFMKASAANRAAFGQARHQAEARLERLNHLVHHDHLTSLLNRRAFEERLSDALMAQRAGDHLSVVLIDLDDFKPVNDAHGHAAGDAILMATAERLSAASGLMAPARLGGDEFVALIPDQPPERVARAIARLSTRLTAPVSFESLSLTVGASIGSAVAKPGMTVPQVLAQADAAMYQQKLVRKGDRRRGAART